MESEIERLITERLMGSLIGECTTSTVPAAGENSNLTLNKLRETIAAFEARKPVLYYATSDLITPGKVFQIDESDSTHKSILCHPDDLDRLRPLLVGFRLVHLRNAPPKIPLPIIPYTPR